jgi:hypothetical protein
MDGQQYYWNSMDAQGVTATAADAQGLMLNTRTGASAAELFKNGASLATRTDSSLPLLDNPLVLMGVTNGDKRL